MLLTIQGLTINCYEMEDFQKKFILARLSYASQRLERLEPIQARLPFVKKEGEKPVEGDGTGAHAYKNNYIPDEYQRVLRCMVSRKVDETWIGFPVKILRQEILSANYELQNHLLNQVSLLMKATDADGSFYKKVYNYLLSNSFLYSLTLEAVASNFNMRMALAVTYLRSGNYPLKDIAFTLGLNEQTAFVRAFRRWTGRTPVAYKTSIQTEK
jgi:AraC-like DNA-binding protein